MREGGDEEVATGKLFIKEEVGGVRQLSFNKGVAFDSKVDGGDMRDPGSGSSCDVPFRRKCGKDGEGNLPLIGVELDGGADRQGQGKRGWELGGGVDGIGDSTMREKEDYDRMINRNNTGLYIDHLLTNATKNNTAKFTHSWVA